MNIVMYAVSADFYALDVENSDKKEVEYGYNWRIITADAIC